MSRKILIRLSIVLVVLLMVGAGVGYWYYIHIFVSTDDAYVAGYVGIISARVPGRVAKVLVDNNQHVTPGQVLATLEPQDYETAVAQAEGNLGRLRQEMAQAYVRVATARTRLPQAEANFHLASVDKNRYTNLYERRTIPKQTLDQVNARYRVNQAEVNRAQKELLESLAAIGGSTDIPIEEQPTIKEARAKLEQARLNLSYTQIKAEIEGYITKRQVEVGNWVQPGQPLMMLVPLKTPQLWIQANYKETQLTHVYIGQPAKVRVDTYPGIEFKGKVDSIMAGTGSAFSLLPPENATGNWVKVVQRIPVKVTLVPPFPANRPLRLGMSTEVTIDTRRRLGKQLLGPDF
ncbi:MAG: efflux RND transporter periplasmic adaptor subunit [Thermodesulfobacteriota bacterium]